jgi:hypothetical protein
MNRSIRLLPVATRLLRPTAPQARAGAKRFIRPLERAKALEPTSQASVCLVERPRSLPFRARARIAGYDDQVLLLQQHNETLDIFATRATEKLAALERSGCAVRHVRLSCGQAEGPQVTRVRRGLARRALQAMGHGGQLLIVLDPHISESARFEAMSLLEWLTPVAVSSGATVAMRFSGESRVSRWAAGAKAFTLQS